MSEYQTLDTIIEHVQEHSKYFGSSLKEPYAVIWKEESFWAASPKELVKLIVEHEEKEETLLRKETSEMLLNIRTMLCERSEKLFCEMTSYSNCIRAKKGSDEYRKWEAEYDASCKEKRSEMDGISKEIKEIDSILSERS